MISVLVVHLSEFQKVWIEEHGRDGRSRSFKADWTNAGSVGDILRSYFNGETRSRQILFVEDFYGFHHIDQVFGRDPFIFFPWESLPIDEVFDGISALLTVKYLFDLMFFNIHYYLWRQEKGFCCDSYSPR